MDKELIRRVMSELGSRTSKRKTAAARANAKRPRKHKKKKQKKVASSQLLASVAA
jgi:hypothetical protein